MALLRRAYDGGIRFFDTARSYSDSEEKLGAAFEGMREKLYIATKTPAQTGEDFWKDLETSLKLLRTDYVDLYQFHNPDFCPKPGDGTGLYEAMLEAKAQGKVRHIGITNHRLHVAQEAIDSGLYETLQFPFSYLSSDKELDLVRQCREKDMGFIAMKALAGGTINNSSAAYAYMLQFDNVLPIWGIQRGWELKEFLNYEKQPPALDDGLRAVIEKDRRELAGNFCRGCGYCMPCPPGHRDQPVRPHVPDAPPGPHPGLAHPGVAGEDGTDHKLRPLQPVRVQVPLWSGHSRPAPGKSQGLPGDPGGKATVRRPVFRLTRNPPSAIMMQ